MVSLRIFKRCYEIPTGFRSIGREFCVCPQPYGTSYIKEFCASANPCAKLPTVVRHARDSRAEAKLLTVLQTGQKNNIKV